MQLPRRGSVWGSFLCQCSFASTISRRTKAPRRPQKHPSPPTVEQDHITHYIVNERYYHWTTRFSRSIRRYWLDDVLYLVTKCSSRGKYCKMLTQIQKKSPFFGSAISMSMLSEEKPGLGIGMCDRASWHHCTNKIERVGEFLEKLGAGHSIISCVVGDLHG